eukprot:TRINITY_DN5407_c0_g1_i6.p1 TRINITY_DN5407_c0_g1~~TRINITY_DN5407_c0_g1_i6.p1  ORF type:complete len:440 (+),score=171.83 TRINITY_DN5407_c0_g1_i6:72-1391(+)
MAQPLTLPSTFPDHASFDEKVRRLYDDMDIHRGRALDMESFVAAFRRMRVAFGPGVVQDLFERGDANSDRVISLSEFQRFGELFPTIVDCMYFRAKDYWTLEQQRREVDGIAQQLDTLVAALGAAQAETGKGEDLLSSSDHRLQTELQALGEVQSQELAAKDDLQQAHAETERGRATLREMLADMNRCTDREKQRGLERAEAARGVEHTQRKVHQQELAMSAAEERLRELQRLVEEQEREVEAQHHALQVQNDALKNAERASRDAADLEAEAREDSEHAGARAADAERNVAALQEAEWSHAQALRSIADDVARRMAARDTEQRTLVSHRESLRHKKHLETQAAEAVEGAKRSMALTEQHYVETESRRRTADAEEQPLLEQEVRLREKRECLETKERKLRTDFQHFTGRGRASPPRVEAIPQSAQRVTYSSYAPQEGRFM